MTRTAIHPGEHLKEELRVLGTSLSELARDIDVPPNRLSTTIQGKRGVSADTALRLAHWFGTTAEFWLNLQTQYELRLARVTAGAAVSVLPTRATLAKLRRR